MSNFAVNFDSLMTTAEVEGSLYAVSLSESSEAQGAGSSRNSNADFSAIGKSIRIELDKLHSQLAAQQTFLESKSVTFAIELAHILLNSSEDVIAKRLQQNITRILDAPESPALEAKIYVHPKYVEVANKWITHGESPNESVGILEVLPEAQLEPGACRVDFGESGRIASLDNQLEILKTKLLQAIGDDPTGVTP